MCQLNSSPPMWQQHMHMHLGQCRQQHVAPTCQHHVGQLHHCKQLPNDGHNVLPSHPCTEGGHSKVALHIEHLLAELKRNSLRQDRTHMQ